MDFEQTYLQLSKDDQSNLKNLTKISSIKEHLRKEQDKYIYIKNQKVKSTYQSINSLRKQK